MKIDDVEYLLRIRRALIDAKLEDGVIKMTTSLRDSIAEGIANVIKNNSVE